MPLATMHERHEQTGRLADEGRYAYNNIATANEAKRKRTMDAAPVCVILGFKLQFLGVAVTITMCKKIYTCA